MDTLRINNSISAYGHLDTVATKKIYCVCGAIEDIDPSYFKRRLSLGKELECSCCRNLRVAREIEELNAHYNGEDVEDSDFIF